MVSSGSMPSKVTWWPIVPPRITCVTSVALLLHIRVSWKHIASFTLGTPSNAQSLDVPLRPQSGKISSTTWSPTHRRRHISAKWVFAALMVMFQLFVYVHVRLHIWHVFLYAIVRSFIDRCEHIAGLFPNANSDIKVYILTGLLRFCFVVGLSTSTRSFLTPSPPPPLFSGSFSHGEIKVVFPLKLE